MLDIKDLIVDVVGGDQTIRNVTGGTDDSPRVYSYYQPTAVIDQYKRAYITYANTVFPERTQAVGEPVFSLAIWGYNLDAVHAVCDRIVALLDDDVRRRAGTLTAYSTATGRVVRFNLIGQRDSYQENTKFSGLTLQFRVGFSSV